MGSCPKKEKKESDRKQTPDGMNAHTQDVEGSPLGSVPKSNFRHLRCPHPLIIKRRRRRRPPQFFFPFPATLSRQTDPECVNKGNSPLFPRPRREAINPCGFHITATRRRRQKARETPDITQKWGSEGRESPGDVKPYSYPHQYIWLKSVIGVRLERRNKKGFCTYAH